jgi:hypothetical protein
MERLTKALAALVGVLLFGGSLAYAQLTPDDGRCTAGLFKAYAGHEMGHDLGALAVGEKPWEAGLWGDKWNDTQRHYKRIALSGFVGQIWTAAVEFGSTDTLSRCAVHGNTLMSAFYSLNAKRFAGNAESYAGHAGDYSAFDVEERKRITVTTLGAAFFLEMAADSIASDENWRSQNSSFFDFRTLMGLPQ